MNTHFGRLGMCLLVIATFAVPAGAARAQTPAEWKVGLAKVKITPEQPVFMAGYASRNRPFDKITADLYAKALALEDRDGQVAVLVTTDLIWLRADMSERVCSRLAEKAGLKREQILLTASHTHTGPALSLGGKKIAADFQRNVDYTHKMLDQLVGLVLEALKERQPARLSWGQGVANFVMNRRQWTDKGVILGMNARGPADRTVPVLRIEFPDGKLRAVVFGAATHNTTLRPNCYEICGDYAGFAQENLEKSHPGAQAMFVLGCAGDSDPYPHGTMDLARKHAAELSQEVDRLLAGKLAPVRGPLRLSFGKADIPLEGSTYSAPFAVWQFGKDLTLVALSGEVVVDYVGFVENALGANRLWVAAYANDVYGYLPSARLLKEGGYETRGMNGRRFSPAAQDAVIAKVRELAAQVGRSGR